MTSAIIPQPQESHPLGSIVIPAHNEEAVIQRCLHALYQGFAPDELDVLVVCNGCVDHTAARARSSGYPVRVWELAEASKSAALRAGDAAAFAFPRVYLDADVVLPGPAARAMLERLASGARAARPPIRYESNGASAPVRSYYRARAGIPAVLGSLWGAGVYGMSAEGRSGFAAFPDVVADDLWVDRLFEPSQVEILDCEPVSVTVPRRTRDLLRVLRRAHRGKADAAPRDGFADRKAPTTTSTLRDLRRRATVGPHAALDAAVYAAFAIGARLTLLGPGRSVIAGSGWERDDSSRGG